MRKINEALRRYDIHKQQQRQQQQYKYQNNQIIKWNDLLTTKTTTLTFNRKYKFESNQIKIKENFC